MTLREELKALLIKVANLDHLSVEEISDDMFLFDGSLGIDSIDLLEFVVHLDKIYKVKIENNDEGKAILKSIDSIAKVIESRAKE